MKLKYLRDHSCKSSVYPSLFYNVFATGALIEVELKQEQKTTKQKFVIQLHSSRSEFKMLYIEVVIGTVDDPTIITK